MSEIGDERGLRMASELAARITQLHGQTNPGIQVSNSVEISSALANQNVTNPDGMK